MVIFTMKKRIFFKAVLLMTVLLFVFLPILSACAGEKESDDPVVKYTSEDNINTAETSEEKLPETTTEEIIGQATTEAPAPAPKTPMNDHGVMGKGVGINPGRVVWAYNPDAFSWDGNGFWWSKNNFNYDIIQKMMDDSITSLAGGADAIASWDLIFKDHNKMRGRTGGYKQGEKIAIKINMNGVNDEKGQTNASFASPVVLKALLVSLVDKAGVAPADITVFDASRVIPSYTMSVCGTGSLQGVNFRFREEGGGHDSIMDKSFPIVWSEKFEGEVCYLPDYLVAADYLINFANLKGHDLAGVTLSAKNHFGTIMNSSRNNPPQAANIHGYVAAQYYSWGEDWTWDQRAMGTYSVLVDFIANKNIGAKTVLYLLDAFAVSDTQSSDITGNTKWKQAPFNGGWPSSLFVSQDSVALDSVGVDFIDNEPNMPYFKETAAGKMTHQNYLHEAALAEKSPSGTIYKNGDGVIVGSLGVHEHWNNATDKQYSRNLGQSEGIELVKIN